MKNLLSITTIMIISLFVVTSSVYAETTTPSPSKKLTRPVRDAQIQNKMRETQGFESAVSGIPSKRIEKMQEKMEDKMQDERQVSPGRENAGDRCEIVTQRVAEFTSRSDKRHQGLVKKYTSMVNRLVKLEAKFAEKEADTAALQEGIDVLEGLVEKLNTDYAAFTGKIDESKKLECGESDGEFKTAMEESRSSMGVVKEDISAIKEHYRTVIRPALIELQQQSGEPVSPQVTSAVTQ